MSLIKCSECGREISDKATACIHCGCPISASKPTTFAGLKVEQTGNPTLNELFGNNSSVQFTKENYIKVEFQAVLSGSEADSSKQSVFVKDLGRNVEFTVSNSIKVGQSIRVRIQTEQYSYILFVVASIAKKEIKQTAAINAASNQEAITLLKNYKPNLLVRFFKSGFIGKVIGMTITFIAIGRFGDVDPDGLFIIGGIGVLLLLICGYYPLANLKHYCKKHHIDEAIRNDTGYMNVAICTYNALPTNKTLTYIRKLNPAAAQEIERQQVERKKK